MAFGSDGRGGNGCLAVEKTGVGDASNMPELKHNETTGLVHGAGDLRPTLDLLIGPDPWSVDVAYTSGGHRGGFGNDQASAGALEVVLRD